MRHDRCSNPRPTAHIWPDDLSEHHAFIGVSGVLAVRITTHQFGEVIEGIARVLRIAVGAINAEEALQGAVIGAMLVRPRI